MPTAALKLGRPVELELGTRTTHAAHFALTFADVEPDKLLVYEDAQRRLAVAVSRGSAAMRLGVSVDDELRITPEVIALFRSAARGSTTA